MSDGLLLGALLMLLGVIIGGAMVWVMERWHDSERALLLRHIGAMQNQLQEMQDSNRGIPEEEL